MMLTIKEVADRLRISLSLAYRLIASGELACHQIAACKRVAEADLQAYLEGQRRRTPTVPRPHHKHF